MGDAISTDGRNLFGVGSITRLAVELPTEYTVRCFWMSGCGLSIATISKCICAYIGTYNKQEIFSSTFDRIILLCLYVYCL